jgi:hypothetical protein
VTAAAGGATAGELVSFEVTIQAPNNNQTHRCFVVSSFADTSGDPAVQIAMGFHNTAAPITGLRLKPDSGTFTSGTFILARRRNAL